MVSTVTREDTYDMPSSKDPAAGRMDQSTRTSGIRAVKELFPLKSKRRQPVPLTVRGIRVETNRPPPIRTDRIVPSLMDQRRETPHSPPLEAARCVPFNS